MNEFELLQEPAAAAAVKKPPPVAATSAPLQQCFVSGCRSSAATASGDGSQRLRFFKPPPNPLIFKRWARILCQQGAAQQQLNYTALICERHFRPQDIREVRTRGLFRAHDNDWR
ncbi:hypothetical protein LSTR_LSTR016356 [Laodelphax striatellus]|uniref:THAP-type domain-containing protein n=1 Tax=Laodelphax striatellus TaxID=195883 RepID=A0A482XLM5_LAOST|nr:hypothetical protein LSTR_LSTR016356 [Laodelphax striatellus]